MLPTKRFVASFLLLIVIGLGSAIGVSADPITISIHLPPSGFLQTAPGSTVIVNGTLTNTTSSTLFVNSSGGAANMNQPPDANIVLSATFFIGPNMTTYVLQPGQSTDIVDFVRLFINPAAPDPSVTGGTIEVCGGADPLACNPLGIAGYSIIVSRTPVPTTSVPEPTTMLLLGTGLAGIATSAYRRRRARRD